MDTTNKNICFVSAFAAPYGGNFIKMLQALAGRLRTCYNCRVYFLFPTQNEKDWINELKAEYEVGLIGTSNVSTDVFQYFNKWKIDLVHTHFESYDIAVAKAIKRSQRDIKQVWHIHDYMSLDKTGLSLPSVRKFFTNQRLWRQYGKWGRSAYFIAVSDEMAHFVNHYRIHRYQYPSQYDDLNSKNDDLIRTSTIINGIDIARISNVNNTHHINKPFTFLTFGGETKRKGIPLILEACEQLYQKNNEFSLFITENYTTMQMLGQRFKKGFPNWLIVKKQTNSISELLSNSDCYISAARHETMSMAIAEASLFGLPVIQSDIPGTMWNASNPSTFLFPVNDATALCETMLNVIRLSKDDKIKDLVNQTREINLKKLNMDLWIDKVIAVYKRI